MPARARSLLFVPADRTDRYAKALASGADCVILDLEDAVAPAAKDAARQAMDAHLAGCAAADLRRLLVRVNPEGTPWHAADLQAVAVAVGRGLAGAMVPKAESAAGLQAVAAALGPAAGLLPLVETLAGLDAVDALAGSAQVLRLGFGHIDFQLDLGLRCTPDEPELAAVRWQLVAASRRHRLPPPVDGVTVATGDAAALARDAQRGRAAGFGAKLCIHPAQVAAVNAAFSPSAAELDWARRVQAGWQAHAGAPFALDGKMVDLPVLRLAQEVLAAPQR